VGYDLDNGKRAEVFPRRLIVSTGMMRTLAIATK